MGNKIATFTEEQLEEYQDCTFLTRKEILRIFKRFREMGDPGKVPKTMTPELASQLKLPLSCLSKIPELKENPFRDRIAEVFTKCSDPGSEQNEEEEEGICFEEFLEMMSVFSEQAPRDLKRDFRNARDYRPPTVGSERQVLGHNPAYKTLLHFDEDGFVGMSDLERTCRQLVQDGLNEEEVGTVCKKILEECDIDGDGALSYLEFENVVAKASDFLSTFHIRV
ncbi:Similar to CIB3: Calcium and integrin-binding family member 3 (Homo sapiens) [Cotesia congregata]|uniref:Similar to CIB3: Calcium and integrin-binding family member 3 (Homo sapiens) n=1 Tax=Cotesia congregata TaxID=51543 RepID=A0A8J2MIK2_COTCN|nr:Similar to CIB3: Calcium and integrin-binding family member 3 (Homo sapiens) [Cotesia congregata]